MSPIVRWGIQLLKSSKWKACWTDKTASYALVEKCRIGKLHDEVFDKSMYMPALLDPQVINGHYARYFRAVKSVENFENCQELGVQLRKSTKMDGAKLISLLNFTVKSHKPQGEVSVRNLHCAGRYSFAGLGLWLQRQFVEKLDQVPFLIKSPAQVKQFVSKIRLTEQLSVYKFDIKEFFVSGPLEELKNDALAIFAEDSAAKRRVISETLETLLVSQFVHSAVTGRCVQVCEGSGMGLPQSGGIADAAFFTKTELPLLQPAARDAAGIVAYMRFKDDGLIFSDNQVGFRNWFQKFKAHAGYFRIICEEVVNFDPSTSHELQFLQFQIVLCANTKKVRVIPHSKSVAVPLCHSSAHSPSTKNWPVAHLRSMCQLASDEQAARETKKEITERFRKNFASPEILLKNLGNLVCRDKNGKYLLGGFRFRGTLLGFLPILEE
eukprot:Skav213078  [mRNA]  locus=scaffold3042:161882:163195:- [translate_table: standard]